MFTFKIEEARRSAQATNMVDLIEATEGLNNAWMNLSEAQRNMDEVCDVMENIQQSLDLVAKFGNDAVPVLNIDKSLESLLGIEEKLITAEKAQEGLGDALKSAWETFKSWVKKIWELIVRAFQAVMSFIKKIFDTGSNVADAVIKAIDKHPSEESFAVSTEAMDDEETGYIDCCSPTGFGMIVSAVSDYLDFAILACAEYKQLYAYLNTLVGNVNNIKTDEVLNRIDSSMNNIVGNKFKPLCVKYAHHFVVRKMKFGNGAAGNTYEFDILIRSSNVENRKSIRAKWKKTDLKKCAIEIGRNSRLNIGWSRLNKDPELVAIIKGDAASPFNLIDRLDYSKIDREKMMALRLLVNFMENVLLIQILKSAVFEFVERSGKYMHSTVKNVASALDVDYKEYIV